MAARPEPASWCRCGVTPIKKRARRPSPKSASRSGSTRRGTSRVREGRATSRVAPRAAVVPIRRRSRAMSYSNFECLKIERHGHVGWLLNNRPDQLNAMNALMRDEFAQAWIELDRDPEVRVIVHTGEGRAFQTGVDVTELAGDGVGMERYRESVEDLDLHFTAWHQKVAKPVITAVNGICAGGGLHWIADPDIVIAASDASFFDPHVSIGQVTALEDTGLIRQL